MRLVRGSGLVRADEVIQDIEKMKIARTLRHASRKKGSVSREGMQERDILLPYK